MKITRLFGGMLAGGMIAAVALLSHTPAGAQVGYWFSHLSPLAKMGMVAVPVFGIPLSLDEAMDALMPNALTVRAQAVSPNDNGRLSYDQLYQEPEEQPDGLELSETILADFRPASDRRELNAPGRAIPLTPVSQRKANILPIESYARIGELEFYTLNATAGNDNDRRLELIGARLPRRVENMALANFRRVELDAYEAALTGALTQRNPQDASKTYVASLNFPAGLIQTAPTAWNDGSLNAWDENLAWLADGQNHIGPIGGEMMRQATFLEIRKDAPTGIGGVELTRAQLEDLISQELGSEFQFIIKEDTIDVFNDGGVGTTKTKVFKAQRILALPADGIIGDRYSAPVLRAGDMEGVPAGLDLSQDVVTEDDINPRGNRVFYVKGNDGKELVAQVQLNDMCVPSETRLWVMSCGV